MDSKQKRLTMNKFEQYFLGITDEDIKAHKKLVRKVKQNTAYLLRTECKKLIKQGF